MRSARLTSARGKLRVADTLVLADFEQRTQHRAQIVWDATRRLGRERGIALHGGHES